MKRIVVTGYKASELGIFTRKHPGIEMIKKAVKKSIVSLVDEGLEWVIVSGQWGVELWAAEAVLELQSEFDTLQLAVITPFLEQDEKWSEDKRDSYSKVIQKANYVNSISNSKYDGAWQFQEKNKFLLRNSDGIVLLYDEEKEGSPKFIKEQALQQAKIRDYRIISISADDLQSIADEDTMHSDYSN